MNFSINRLNPCLQLHLLPILTYNFCPCPSKGKVTQKMITKWLVEFDQTALSWYIRFRIESNPSSNGFHIPESDQDIGFLSSRAVDVHRLSSEL